MHGDRDRRPLTTLQTNNQQPATGCRLSAVILSPVRVLYGVLLLCTMALLGAALAVVRHIRHQRESEASKTPQHHDEPL
jgi:hypothetical protein